MYSKLFSKVLIFILNILGILGLVYIGLGYYYCTHFSYGTYINGNYCTGYTVSEVNDLLYSQYSYGGLEVTDDILGLSLCINQDDIDLSVDYYDEIKVYMDKQNAWIWPVNILENRNIVIDPEISFAKENITSIVENEYAVPDSTVCIEYLNGEYKLIDTTHNRPDVEKISAGICKAIAEDKREMSIDKDYFYNDTYSASQKQTIDLFEKIDKTLSADIKYILGDDCEEIDKKTLTSFLMRDETNELVLDDDNQYVWDETKIEAWVDSLADKYDSVGKDRMFRTTEGDEIEIKGGIYGNEINRKAEKEYLINAIRTGRSENHEPEYLQKGFKQGLNDIGDTYIEVNMTTQKLYYYLDGELLIDTPVVTGNISRRMGTPTGTNYVYFMQRNRTLHGATYDSFVKYWIAVKGHIGIHDASWRDEFGGDIYKTGGSHGCINTPEENVSKLYDMVELGTPVLMFYLPNEE